MEFCKRLEYLCEKSGKPQKELAEGMDISQQALSDYLRGNRNPGLLQFQRIANYFGVTLDYLAGNAEGATADNESIHKRLGLSDKAISALEKNYQEQPFGDEAAFTVNAMLSTPSGQKLIRNISAYCKVKPDDKMYDFSDDKSSGFEMVEFRLGIEKKVSVTMLAETVKNGLLVDIPAFVQAMYVDLGGSPLERKERAATLFNLRPYDR